MSLELPEFNNEIKKAIKGECIRIQKQVNKRNVNLVQKVDKFVAEMGLNDENLGLKTKYDKMQFYQNCMEKDNVFTGVTELSKCNYMRLANYLCNNEERLKLFKEKIYNPDENLEYQFRKFRRYLLESRESTISVNLLQEAIDAKEWFIVYECLQMLWLDPFDITYMDSFKKKIDEGLNGQDIMNWYEKNRTGSALSILTLDIGYIKSFSK